MKLSDAKTIDTDWETVFVALLDPDEWLDT
ncbi:hypothetical protein PhaeoP75_03925 (plasmid) [Phaeobacter gallaeciensis]|uniref:Uncharacterized protein n=1 Tax=Phaeobacter gallaeciensis TaxID=60890 RepID=A0AAC9ZCA6_9RHOB|nr:hypothetical protein Gal_03890 [Phaeobacter gallaeciensis DSM 26640]ATE94862.1 hypothetical protein PhaeoP11_03876 [Phaeobacter gallaeciensis]ATE99133.1 hypothetical protein PhaeoP73_03872 [Phaeobacter gallaeciensis]ATF03526.1 hypothetical protein PhaeoP75_03925 [Phaeobacter gallaeciensis]ATF07906.1 hypothetical protein PhaeoP63_03874 [Phaeobacter gallaeciensis]